MKNILPEKSRSICTELINPTHVIRVLFAHHVCVAIPSMKVAPPVFVNHKSLNSSNFLLQFNTPCWLYR